MSLQEQVVELRREAPRARAALMARELGVSREAVRLALVSSGLQTSFHKRWYCLGCGKRVGSGGTLCRKCWIASHYESYTCEVCGAKKRVLKSQLRYLTTKGHSPRFCSNKCRGAWLGSTYGLGRPRSELDGQG